MPRQTQAARDAAFWSRVSKGGECWLWTGGTSGANGYGKTSLHGVKVYVHRLSYDMHNAEPAPAHLDVCHSCDVRLCVNPAHLFVGTHKVNMEDCAAKGRTCRGERVRTAKLTEIGVLEFRSRLGRGERQSDLRREFGLSKATASALANGKTWKHVGRA